MVTRHVSLLTLILVPTACLVLAVLASLAIWTHYSDLRLLDRTHLRLSEQLGLRVATELDEALSTPPILLEQTRQLLAAGVLDPADETAMERFFAQTIRTYPWITNLALGTEDGRYINAYRYWESPEQIYVSNATAEGQLRAYSVDDRGARKAADWAREGFTVHQRPWYRAASNASEEAVWFEPYTFFSGDAVALGVSRQVSLANDLRGVIAADLSLNGICRFLSALELFEGATIYIMNTDGFLLADSSGVVPIKQIEGFSSLLRATDSPAEAIQTSSRRVLEAQGRLNERMQWGGDEHLVRAQRFEKPGGLELIIVTTLPREALVKLLDTEGRQRLAASAIILALALLVCWLIARSISRPVLQLIGATRALEAGDVGKAAPESRIREISALSRSVTRMGEHLHQILVSLEARVRARTDELEQANVKLNELTRTDQLTGLPNRRRFDEHLRQEWRRATRERYPLSLVFCDIDWFKDYNDSYGHPAGDRALVQVADTLAASIRRPGDLAARIGGEEFVLVLPRLDEDAAVAFAEQVRLEIFARGLPHRASPFERVTLSLGVTSIEPTGDPQELNALMSAADQGLYLAKSEGRNRVCAAPAVPSPELETIPPE
ncbi:sensor domain-containing diguanylate cyclase [Wenzhouxiangella marina]|uniref:diguanylate cyclase n=1 Tax=Wenzhouxiangella marina TaxID=1579979 RepID=A0A0K0XUG6_9GAMM|nr:sensor domain-containing diguanylate cyclase [Wenzhouxiangella marina]AKS41328.1 hypothetical protein WM2015_947 [Wenzhouxiangella marina]MBB6086922.1 diguanylate cyclase (GGDEF)-like protein [Wenzhouxiangella marina]